MLTKYLYTIFNIKKNLISYNKLKKNPFGNIGFARVYHHHLMKTGGTSLNSMFLNLSKKDTLMNKLMMCKDLRIVEKDWIYTAHNQSLIAFGLFHYAWSHRPIYKTIIPKKTFIITSLRHPYERVYSRYKQLIKNFNNGDYLRDDFKNEYKLLGNNFEDYLKNISQNELCHQLYMFSSKLDINQGLDRLSKINFIIDLKNFNRDIITLNKILGINLEPIHTRKSFESKKINFNQSFKKVEDLIKPEIEFYNKALEIKYNL